MTTATANAGTKGFESEPLPLWREALTGLDWLALHRSLVYLGIGVPHGKGAPVILVPGFLGVDSYLIELYLWLWRMGYQPHMSEMGRNAECLEVLSDRLQETIDRVRLQTKQRVTLIGHSLGGTLARSVTMRKPPLVAQVITLGSPVLSIRAHPWVLALARIVKFRIDLGRYRQPDCYTSACTCAFAQSLNEGVLPKSVDTVSIYTKDDGVVDWRFCIDEDASLNREVSGTHCGLVVNPAVFETIAHELYRFQQEKRTVA